jgi:hypothetical protein
MGARLDAPARPVLGAGPGAVAGIPLTDITPAGRLRLEERQEIPDHAQRQDPKKYKGNNDDSNDYRSEGFHFAPIVIMSIERSGIDGIRHADRRAGIWISGPAK